MDREAVIVLLFRIAMVVTIPFVMPWIIVASICREMRRALYLAWLDIKIEWYSLVGMLRSPPIGKGEPDV